MAKWRYVPQGKNARRRMQDQVYYLQCRDNEEAEDQTRQLFTGDDTGITRAEARSYLWAQLDRKVAFHRYILSPSAALREGLQSEAALMAWTREVMQAYGTHLGLELRYVAAAHRNTNHAHVHILIAGSARRRTDGAWRSVRIKEQDHAAIRAASVRAGERMAAEAREARRAALWRELDAMAAAWPLEQAQMIDHEEDPHHDHHQGIVRRIFGRLGGRRGARDHAPGPA